MMPRFAFEHGSAIRLRDLPCRPEDIAALHEVGGAATEQVHRTGEIHRFYRGHRKSRLACLPLLRSDVEGQWQNRPMFLQNREPQIFETCDDSWSRDFLLTDVAAFKCERGNAGLGGVRW